MCYIVHAHIKGRQSYLPSWKFYQEVVKVTVAKADDVTNHAHDSSGAGVGLSRTPPLRGTGGGTPELPETTPTYTIIRT